MTQEVNFAGGKYLLFGSISKNNKIAAFDLDNTLIKTKSGNKFPKDNNDWDWWNTSVPSVLQSLSKRKYTIVIFSNQYKRPDITAKIKNMHKKLQIPLQVFISLDKDKFRKPHVGMWELFKCVNNIDNFTKAFYCGDAGGRSKDFSASDYMFAKNIEIPFFFPEEIFNNATVKKPILKYPDLQKVIDTTFHPKFDKKSQELVLFIGAPASGKSLFYNRFFKKYIHVNQDTLKTKAKCLKVTTLALENGESVVVDNTNPTDEVREEYMKIAKSLHIPIRIFYFDIPSEISQHLNNVRVALGGMHIPIIAFRFFYKKLSIPKSAIVIDKIYFRNIPSEYYKFYELEK